MAYRDPYTKQYGQQYTDARGFDSYNNAQPHQAYDQSGYDPYEDTHHGQSMNPGGSAFAPGHQKSESTTQYDQGAFARATTGDRPQDPSHWRQEYHGSLWTKGGRGACVGRFCCCTLMVVVFFIISILLPLALWTRPPNIIVGSVQAPSNGSEIQLLDNGVELNLAIPFKVLNYNYFGASCSILAKIYYPIGHTLIGQGQLEDVTFHSHSSTNFTFPFSIQYTTTMSSSAQIIADLASKCGIEGGAVSDITVDYDITLALRVLFFTISPTISNSASFRCPLTASDLGSLISAISGSG